MEDPTWRPGRGRIVPYGFAAVLAIMGVVLAVIVPSQFQLGDRIGFVVVCGGLAAVLCLLGRSKVTADRDGLTVVNVLKTHRVSWDEITGMRFGDGDPWLHLELTDGSTLGVMGIQSADGDRAKNAVEDLTRRLEAHR